MLWLIRKKLSGSSLRLQRLQPRVLLRPVGLADAIRALVAEEVDVDALVPRLERRPEVAHPLALLLEALGALGAGADVVGEAGAPSVEGGLVLADAVDGTTHLPDRKRRQRRGDLERALHRDVDDLVGELGESQLLK